jgi:uncharacterized protein (DUF362 family)/NAD-dependent dihydropyrimidine dehydrogenase PreA subunit
MQANTQQNTVSFKHHTAYQTGLYEACKELVGNLGGIEQVVRPGNRVLIKPNLLSDKPPGAAVTTHPEMIRAFIRLAKDAGGEPEVADSSASPVKTCEVWRISGAEQVCREEKVPLLNLEESGSKRISVDGCEFSIATPVLECDVLVNLAKAKTHVLTTLTAAMKNLYGTVPGYQKAMLHAAHPTPRDFGALIAGIYRTLRPSLNIVEAIWAMEGEGPSAGRRTDLNFLAASRDALALDMAVCDILRINKDSVPYLRCMKARGPRPGVYPQYAVAGDSLEEIRPKHFKQPGTAKARLIPGPLVRLLSHHLWIRPRIGTGCTACGRCIEACPADALYPDPETHKPCLDSENCIGCCCCHEICPYNAIDIVQSPLLNLIRGGRLP